MPCKPVPAWITLHCPLFMSKVAKLLLVVDIDCLRLPPTVKSFDCPDESVPNAPLFSNFKKAELSAE